VGTGDNQRGLWLQQVYVRGGWMRQLPATAIGIFGPLLDGPKTVNEVEDELRLSQETAEGWHSAAWESLRQWTDEELVRLRADSPFGPADDEDDQDAEAVVANDAARRAKHLAAMDHYSQVLGCQPVRTVGDLLDFVVACGLLTRVGAGGTALLDLTAAALLPGEALPLPASEQAAEDEMRWQRAHEEHAQAIIRLFDPHAVDRIERVRTTLQRLARRLDLDVESVRAGALILIGEGDFTATRDLERTLEHQVFDLVVDWDAFANKRITIRHAQLEQPDE